MMQVEFALQGLIRSIQEVKEEARKDIQEITALVVAGKCTPEDAEVCIQYVDLTVSSGIIGEEEVGSTRQLLEFIAEKKI